MTVSAIILLLCSSAFIQAKGQLPLSSSSANLEDALSSDIGAENLFRDLEEQDKSSEQTEPLIESSFGANDISLIKPSRVERTQQLAESKKISDKDFTQESVQIVEPAQVQPDSFRGQFSGFGQQNPKKRENQNLDDSTFDASHEGTSATGSRLQQSRIQKEAATNSLRERLKNRFQKFKTQQVNVEDDSSRKTSLPRVPSLTGQRAPSFQRSKARNVVANTDLVDEVQEDEDELEVDRVGSGRAFTIGSANRRNFREPPSGRSRNRNNPTEAPRHNSADLTSQASIQHDTVAHFGSKKRNNPFRDRNSGLSRVRQPSSQSSSSPPEESTHKSFANPDLVRGIQSIKQSRPQSDFAFQSKPSSGVVAPKTNVVLKSFDRYSRPDIRKSLLDKILSKGKGENTIDPEVLKSKKESALENESLIDDSNDITDEEKLQTTLEVSTIHPTNLPPSEYLEVATIRSPYSFDYEDGKSTRYITVTRTFTNTEIEPSTISPSSVEATMAPVFQTETIPAPENILASTSLPFDTSVLEISSGIETLPAVVIESSTSTGTPPLKTVTETFSTRELSLKTSILPIVVNGKTSLHTLTQSFYITKLVEAVKTLPPGENYEFVATKAFKDVNNVLEEAGSEKREQLLPGELEFSDQDNFDLNGPKEVRVPPPEGFADDLKILGTKFVEDPKEPNVNIEPSSTATAPEQANPASLTPSLPQFNPLANFSPEQIQQLALLQYLQNFGGFPGFQNNFFNQPQEVVTSSPIYKTETLFATSTIPLFLGAKKFFTTLTQSIGMTTITEFDTVTVSSQSKENNPFGNLFPVAPTGTVAPGFTETSHPVVKDTEIPSTIYKEIRITFRNSPTVTTLTSTTMVSTQVTSYVTKTIKAQQTLNPFNPFAAFG